MSDGHRDEKVRVKSARGRKTSSTRWLQRQLNDPYVKQAKRDGYRSRAAYKLVDLDDKFKFLKPGMKVLDLGAAPGGWTQVAITRTKSSPSAPNVLGIDLLPMQSIAGSELLQLDFNDSAAPDIITEALGGQANIVLSDMAPNTTGHAATDHLRIMGLCELAYGFATQILTQGGVFVCKVRQGGTENALLADMKMRFSSVAHAKPKSSRKDSSETYVVARGFRN